MSLLSEKNHSRYKFEILVSTCYRLRIMLAKANSTADVTFDDMDVIVEPPWMASRRVTEAVEFGVQTSDILSV